MKGFKQFARKVHDYKDFVDKFSSLCSKHKGELVSIGSIGDNHNLYKATFNKDEYSTVVISTGIHGDEIAGPYGLLNWLENYDISSYKVKIVVLPLNNPVGFTHHTRHNKNNHDLNRDFCDSKASKDSKMLLNSIKNESPYLFVTLHEDEGTEARFDPPDSFYLYYSDKKFEQLCNKLTTVAKKYFPVNKQKKIRGDDAKDGLIYLKKDSGDCTFEDKMRKQGVPYITTETPGKAQLSRRVRCTAELIDTILRSSS